MSLPFLESYSQAGSGFVRFDGRAMGTANVLLLEEGDPRLTKDVAREAFDTLERLELSLSKFRPESDVTLVNTLAASRPVKVGAELLELLLRAREAWELTGGAFDPTVGPLLEAWGFVDMRGRVPSQTEIGRLLHQRGMDLVLVDRDTETVRFRRPGVSLDLGGIAKGFAADVVTRRILERGISRGAFLSGRSSVVTWGRPPKETSWLVEVVHPLEPTEPLCELSAEPGALSSSGAYERAVRSRGEVLGHVLDPRTGLPVKSLAATTVWTRSALLGDVLSTTLFVLGGSALGTSGCLEKLVKRWTPSEEEPRATVLLVEKDPTAWGGLKTRVHSVGRRGFVLD